MMESEMPTERGQYRFTVKEGTTDTPFLAAEPAGEILTSLKGQIAFVLQPGTTLEAAAGIAKYLNEHIAAITLTS
jgi:hypothetical protein